MNFKKIAVACSIAMFSLVDVNALSARLSESLRRAPERRAAIQSLSGHLPDHAMYDDYYVGQWFGRALNVIMAEADEDAGEDLADADSALKWNMLGALGALSLTESGEDTELLTPVTIGNNILDTVAHFGIAVGTNLSSAEGADGASPVGAPYSLLRRLALLKGILEKARTAGEGGTEATETFVGMGAVVFPAFRTFLRELVLQASTEGALLNGIYREPVAEGDAGD